MEILTNLYAIFHEHNPGLDRIAMSIHISTVQYGFVKDFSMPPKIPWRIGSVLPVIRMILWIDSNETILECCAGNYNKIYT
jgi:hypothetical protein